MIINHGLTRESNLNYDSVDHHIIIMTNLFSHNQDNHLNQYHPQPEVNLNKLQHTYNAQTITNLIVIPFAQCNLFTSLSYKILNFSHRVLIKEKQNLFNPKKKMIKPNKRYTSAYITSNFLNNCNSSE